MKIKKIAITNYRGIISKQEILLSDFTTIVGKNDTGKSIILNAIATFLDIKNYPIVISDFNDQNQPIIIECSFIDDALSQILENKLKSKIKKDDGLDVFLEDLIINNTLIVRKTYSQIGKKSELEEVLFRDYNNPDFKMIYTKSDEELSSLLEKYHINIPVSGVGRNSKLEKIKYIKAYCKEQEIETHTIPIEDNNKITSLLPSVELFVSDYGLKADTTFKTASVTEIIDYFDRETADETKKLKIAETEIQTELNKEAELIKDFMLDYTSNLEKIEIIPTIAWKDAIKSVDVNFQFQGDTKPIPMSHKGTGYRRLFMVARFRYLAEKNKGENIVFLIEEPETYLHPSAQQDLLNSFEELSEDNQIIISTHSPVFAGATQYDSIVLCRKENQSIYEYADEVNKQEFIEKIISELGIKPAYNLIDNFTKILFVEGKNDRIFFDIICRKVLEKPLIDNNKVLVLPFGGGKDIDSFINIDYFSKSQRELYLIIDSDKQENNEAYQLQRIAEFNQKDKSKGYMLKKSCIENYYHPRAFERHYDLMTGLIPDFSEDDNVKKKLKQIVEDNDLTNKNIKQKNNIEVYEITTKPEWIEIIEPELIDFLREITND